MREEIRKQTMAEALVEARKQLEEARYRLDKTEAVLAEATERMTAQQAPPPVTGRPFMESLSKPKEGWQVWTLSESRTEPIQITYCSYNSAQIHMLRNGLLYPTEADCRLGSLRDEIKKLYHVMGDGYDATKGNWTAYFCSKDGSISVRSLGDCITGETIFRTPEGCLAAVSFVNAKYGVGAFTQHVLEAKIDGH